MGLRKQEDITYVNIKLSGTEGKNGNPATDMPIFEIGKTGEYNSAFDGDLLDIALKPATEKYPFEQVSMRFIDDEFKLYSVSVGFNGALDNLINCFIGGVNTKSDFKKIGLSLYKSGDFANIGVFKDRVKMERGFDPVTTYNVLKEKKRLNGKDVTDREKLDVFLKEKVLEISAYLKTLNGLDENPFDVDEENGVGDKLREKANDENEDSELPF